ENRDELRVLPVDEWGANADERLRAARQIMQFLESYLRRLGDAAQIRLQKLHDLPGRPEIMQFLESYLRRLGDAAQGEKVMANVETEVETLKAGTPFDGMRKYTSAVFPGYENLLRYMPPETLVVFDEPSRIFELARQMEKDEAETVSMLMEEGKLLPQL